MGVCKRCVCVGCVGVCLWSQGFVRLVLRASQLLIGDIGR